jgi:kinesin family protein 3/17
MIALTTRLNERDETILQLQEELDAYDKIQRELEDMLQNRIRLSNIMEELLQQNSIVLPKEFSEQLSQSKYYQPQLYLGQS